jgi:hypothetical protein
MRRASALGLVLLLLGLLWPASLSAQSYRVGLQVGHWRSNELPEELKSLRGNTGAAAGGVREVQVNLDVAQRAAGYLRSMGVAVDVLPATVPPNYRADAFIAIHADGSPSTRATGYKIATHWREWEAGTALVDALRAEYGPASGLSWDGSRITSGMRGYYAFSSGRYTHAIANDTPGAILEMGYVTNPNDRRLMTQNADRLARGVANGVMRFLRSRPATGWTPPPPLPDWRATVTSSSANVRAGPGTTFEILRTVPRGRTMMVAEIRGEWLRLYSFRANSTARWVHRNNVRLVYLPDEAPQDS